MSTANDIPVTTDKPATKKAAPKTIKKRIR